MKKLKLRQYTTQRTLIFVLFFAVLGVSTILITHAATSTISVEPENGALKGGASLHSDSSASGGKYVQFNKTPSNPCVATDTTKTFTTFGKYLSQPGDQVISIPDGTYYPVHEARSFSDPHASTNGVCKGWLILKPEHPGKVTIDLTYLSGTNNDRKGMDLTGSSRIMFVGLNFVKGSVYPSGNNIIFWYTTHSFFQTTVPASGEQARITEAAQYGYIKARIAYVQGQNISFLGSDMSNTCSGIKQQDSMTNLQVLGTRVYEVGPSMHDGDLPNQCHDDSIAMESNVQVGTLISDSNTEGRIEIESGNSNASITIKNMWMHGSDGTGLSFTSNYIGKATLRNLYSWNNNGNADYDVYSIGGTLDVGGDAVGNLHLKSSLPKDKFNGLPPPGITSTDDKTIRENINDPALLWRQSHPIDSWYNFLN